MPLREGDANDPAATRFDGFPADDRVSLPVGALDEHVGLQAADDLLRVVLVEHDDGIHAREAGEHFGALVLWVERAGGSFDCAHRTVGIDGDDKRVPFAAGILQIPYMARVQQIEYTVCEHDFPARMAEMFHERHRFRERQDFLAHARYSVFRSEMLGENVQAWRGR